ncbi:hypothetical protein RSOLAG1IB_10942 [Rhizoctonia solani AG-1 IB]|nr:hypothetical protein RSOLAG1IB_10942 [Rhizoctonia solani AG-1 IB]
MEQPSIQRSRSRRGGVYNQIGLNKRITVSGRRPAPTTVEESTRPPSLLKVKPTRLSKSEFIALSDRDRARDELLMKDKLSQRQQADLRMLQEQIHVDERVDGEGEAMYDSMDIDWVDDSGATACSGEAVEELEVIEELGVRTESSEWANRVNSEHQAWKEQIKDLFDEFLEYCSAR